MSLLKSFLILEDINYRKENKINKKRLAEIESYRNLY